MPRKHAMIALVINLALASATEAHTAENTVAAFDPPYIEFLWQASPPGSGARQEARGLLMHPARPHQVCWKSLHLPPKSLQVTVTATDANEHEVWRHDSKVDSQAGHVVACTNIEVGSTLAAPGLWRFDVFFDSQQAASRKIEVASDLKSAHFFANPNLPYTIGRVNYSAIIPPQQWKGHFLWHMTIGPDGTVIKAENKETVGAAKKLAGAGAQAAQLFLFPPDPARRAEPMEVEQRYDLSPSR